MNTLETVNTEKLVAQNKAPNVLAIDDNSMFQIIEQNMSHLKACSSSNDNYFGKLSLISSILRAFDLQELTVEQNFAHPTNEKLVNNYVFSVLAESIYSDGKTKKNDVLEKFSRLKKEYETTEQSNNTKYINPIWSQKSHIKELFHKIYSQVKEDLDATVALTSFFLFELETIQLYGSINSIAFYDLYDLNNPHDKWFSAIDIYLKDSEQKKIIQ